MGLSSPTQRRESSLGFIPAKVHDASPAQHPLITIASHNPCGDVSAVNTVVFKSYSHSHLVPVLLLALCSLVNYLTRS